MTACQVRGYCLNHGDPLLRLSGVVLGAARSYKLARRRLPIRRVVSDVALRGGERQRMAGAASFAAARAKGSFRCTGDGLQPRRAAAECLPQFNFAAPAAAGNR